MRTRTRCRGVPTARSSCSTRASARRTPTVVRVDLTLRTPKFAEDQFRDLFKENPGAIGRSPVDRRCAAAAGTAAAARATAKRGGQARRDRTSTTSAAASARCPSATNYSAEAISPDGKWLLANGDGNLYVYPLDAPVGGGGRGGGAGGWRQSDAAAHDYAGRQVERAVHAGQPRGVLSRRRPHQRRRPSKSRQSRAVDVTAELDVDFSQEKMEVFRQAWTYMRDGFYDEKFHGADWSEVRAQFTPIVAGVRTTDELRRVLNLMLGELNSSHLGASGPAAAGGPGVEQRPSRPVLRSRRVRIERDACASPRSCRSVRRRSPSRSRRATTSCRSTASTSAPRRIWTSS